MKQSAFFKAIRTNPLFSEMTEKEINTIFNCMQGRIVIKSKGMLIAKEDTLIDDICIVLEGTLLKFTTKLNGQKEPLGLLEAGEMFGLHQGYLEDKKLGYYVVAAKDVTLLYLKISTIVTMCKNACKCHQELINRAFEYLSQKINKLHSNRNYITIKGMRQKIAKLLYDKYLERGNKSLALGMDRNQMATYLNVSRPSMSREMMRMRDEGIIEFWKDKITITDVQTLEGIVKGE